MVYCVGCSRGWSCSKTASVIARSAVRLRCYVQGLLSDSRRKSMEAMWARLSDPGSYQALQHLITHAPWDAERSCLQGHSAHFGASCRRGGGPSDLTSGEPAMSSTI